MTPVHWASQNQKFKSLKMLLNDERIQINIKDNIIFLISKLFLFIWNMFNLFWNLFHWASQSDNLDIVKYLIDLPNLCINDKDSKGVIFFILILLYIEQI